MGQLTGIVEVLEGKPYFRHESACYSEPTLAIAWWRLPDSATRFEGCECHWSNTGGPHWTVQRGGGRILTYPDHRRGAKPDRHETQPIPPPKTRLETRWGDGHWQKKYAKGWR